MKKKFFIAAVLLAATFCFSACGQDPVPEPDPSDKDPIVTPTPPSQGEGEEFTAKLVYNDKPYTQSGDLYVVWSTAYSKVKAKVENGVAKAEGLDGEYSVTIEGLSSSYTYDPNIYKASNDNKDTEIEIFRYSSARGKGTDLYSCVKLSTEGVYKSTINSKGQVVFYEFQPNIEGYYEVESWVDVTENRINPIADVYNGTSSFKVLSHTQDDGGAASTFTKNFVVAVDIGQSYLKNCFTFGLKADIQSGDYPVTVSFRLRRIKSGTDHESESKVILVEKDDNGDPVQCKPLSQEMLADAYSKTRKEAYIIKNGRRVLDETLYKYNEATGYFHRYSEETGYGAVLYAYISQACLVLDLPFTAIEYQGNKALQVSAGEHYKVFIEGGKGIMSHPATDRWYRAEEFQDEIGYADYCNSDGCYPVTKELQDFLMKYAVSQRLFFDGNGVAEYAGEEGGITLASDEASQWLFACCYYE